MFIPVLESVGMLNCVCRYIINFNNLFLSLKNLGIDQTLLEVLLILSYLTIITPKRHDCYGPHLIVVDLRVSIIMQSAPCSMAEKKSKNFGIKLTPKFMLFQPPHRLLHFSSGICSSTNSYFSPPQRNSTYHTRQSSDSSGSSFLLHW